MRTSMRRRSREYEIGRPKTIATIATIAKQKYPVASITSSFDEDGRKSPDPVIRVELSMVAGEPFHSLDTVYMNTVELHQRALAASNQSSKVVMQQFGIAIPSKTTGGLPGRT